MAAKIFISHSTMDKKIADNIVQLLHGAFQLDEREIICSSGEAHRLKAGTRFFDLKNEIKGAVVLILATANSIKSEWVLTEIGAAWATAKLSIVMFGNGLRMEDIRGPLRDTLMLDLKDPSSLKNLVDTLSGELVDVNRKGVGSISSAIDRYLREYENSSFENLHDRILFREDLTDEKNGMKWKQIFSRSRKDVFIFGWSCLNTWKAGDGRIWTDYLERGRIRFLSQDPDAFGASNGLQYRHICNKASEIDVLNDIVEAEKNFSGKMVIHKNLVAKKTRCLLSWSGVLIDGGADDAMIQVELYNYGDPHGLDDKHLNKRTNLIFHRDSPYFKGFAGSIEEIWASNSVPL